MSIPTLGYWDIQGLGQPLRMILAYLDIEHEDIVYDNTTLRTTWVTDIKPNLGLDFPNVPYYKDGDLKITQSLAIIRYIGKKHGMYGWIRKVPRLTCFWNFQEIWSLELDLQLLIRVL